MGTIQTIEMALDHFQRITSTELIFQTSFVDVPYTKNDRIKFVNCSQSYLVQPKRITYFFFLYISILDDVASRAPNITPCPFSRITMFTILCVSDAGLCIVFRR